MKTAYIIKITAIMNTTKINIDQITSELLSMCLP